MTNKLPKIEKDLAYRKRGGTAQWLLLLCGTCKKEITLYQKDGPGQLLRLYLDRITGSQGERPFKNINYEQIKNLSCLACNSVIATPMIYGKDDRPRTALRLINNGVEKVQLNYKDKPFSGPIIPLETMKTILVTYPEAND